MYKVLVVEDEDIIRKGLIYMVDWSKLNCIVIGEAVNGLDGLEKIGQLNPDIIITDVRMPFLDGIQMLEKSKNRYNYNAIIISGYSEFEYAQKAISLGVTEYILKPIDTNILNDAIMKIIQKLEEDRNVLEKLKTNEELNLYKDILNMINYNDIKSKSNYVKIMLEYIEENYKYKISLTDLSEELNLSTVYLNSLFKKSTKYTFNDYLNRYRVLKSIQLLKNSNMLIYEIADAVGFQDYKYFNHVFKKYVGTSPTSFMEFNTSLE